MKNHLILITSLFAVWVVLSGYIEIFFIVLGLSSCALTYWVSKRMGVIENDYPIFLIPLLPVYLAWLYKEVVLASIDVSMRVWRVKPDISPVVGWVPTSQGNEMSTAFYANSITLTPGTVCIDAKKNMLEVHALSPEIMKDLQKGNMDRKVTRTAG